MGLWLALRMDTKTTYNLINTLEFQIQTVYWIKLYVTNTNLLDFNLNTVGTSGAVLIQLHVDNVFG